MSVPGAENPDKVRNIVAGQGAREGMRGMYGELVKELGVRYEGEASGGEKGERAGEWVWEEDGMLCVCPLLPIAWGHLVLQSHQDLGQFPVISMRPDSGLGVHTLRAIY
jgi:hypothetical protein